MFKIKKNLLFVKFNIGIIGLGYVGLPLFIKLEKSFKNIIGFDLSNKRIEELRNNFDNTNEISSNELKKTNKSFFNQIENLAKCNFFIICVPTPIKKNKKPDLSYLNYSIELLSRIFKPNDTFVIESTVYPGVTKLLAKKMANLTNLQINKNFFYGYSPERINPGDNKNTISKITKIVSGSNKVTLNKLSKVYSKVTKKIFKMNCVEEAEMAKVIENTQRDVNIALINEIKIISNKLGLNNEHILEGASTKWNFHKYTHGLVGGHCIGVDPYYLADLAINLKIQPKVILAGRDVNDGMAINLGKFILENIKTKKSKILICGLTFKENIPDIRNSGSFEVFNFLKKSKKINIIDLHDPFISSIPEYKDHFNYTNKKYDMIIFLVSHNYYKKNYKVVIKKFLKQDGKIIDFKNFINSKKLNILKY